MQIMISMITILLCMYSGAGAHTVNYHVENKGISIRVFYDVDDPACYASYEIFGPADTLVHQKGRTDKNGVVSFLPDRNGTWTVKVYDESDHGMHAAQIEVNINEDLFMDSFKKPLVAKHTKAFVGMSLILALFGLWTLIKSFTKRKNG